MIRLALRSFPLVLALAITGCANIKIDATGASPATVEKLRAASLAPTQVGAFKLAAGKDPAMDTTLSGLRGSTLGPAKGSWSQLLKDTLVAELTASGLHDSASRSIIEGQLTESMVDAAIGTGQARLAARFTVANGGRVLYDKEVEGHKKVSIQRSTFVIDKSGKLRHALYAVHAHGHADEILNLIKEMK